MSIGTLACPGELFRLPMISFREEKDADSLISTAFNYGTYQICIIFEGFNTVQQAQIGFVDITGARLEEILDLNVGICEHCRGKNRRKKFIFPLKLIGKCLINPSFFFLGAALFSGVSATLYPVVVLKTRQQVAQSQVSCLKTAISMVRHEGFRALYRGFGTSLMGTIPARALYMAALEVTKSKVGTATIRLGFSESTAAAIANAAAGLSAAMAAQIVWTPVDVVSQRLMVQGGVKSSSKFPNASDCKYVNGIDAFRKIIKTDGPRGLYRGFGISILTYAPSNAVWWASYSVAQRMVWGGVGYQFCKKSVESNEDGVTTYKPDSKTIMAVQGVSAAMAGGMSALITMPLDTVKTRLQVLDGEDNGRRGPTIGQTVRNLVKEGGWTACYRGLGPRWASMSISATTMITTYEFLKRLSTKNQEVLT
ncbi:solute carrier family 25 member 44 [Prunus yedoensis var. nudiflora]|uniref:Solute carrier family 25 member 44 n=1 Tax=Prunus yedoensis var. nudiflora TaxID=2094558 RepID=A0A314XHY4_PRUYE|nr:solute carrier family 25 member 44 [Prunus yedoensis var. nudiflora]